MENDEKKLIDEETSADEETSSDEESSENGKTDPGDPGLFPGRSCVLPVL